MDFDLNEEQKLLKTNARAFMEREILPIVNDYEQKYRPLPQDISLDLMRKISPLGYTGGMVPPAYDGGGMNFFAYGIILEELSRAWGSLALMVFVHHAMAMQLAWNGNEEQKKKYLTRMASGDLIGCACLTEPNAGSSNREMETTIVRDGDYYIVNGTKTWITNGGVGDLCMVIGYSDKSKGIHGISQILVDRSESPFEARELPKMGFRCCPTAEITFSDSRVPKRNLFIQEGKGYGSIVGSLYVGRCCIGICSVGLAQAAIDEATKYALERKQFGKPIARFQLVQQLLAEMVIELEAIRLLTYKTMYLIDKEQPCDKESSGVKFMASETAARICSKAMEILGAYGISEEYPLERYFRDSRSYWPPDGTNQIQRLIVGREVLGLSAFI